MGKGGRAIKRYFRLHPEDDDPQRLLDPAEQESEPWHGTIFGRCDKCDGSGKTEYEREGRVDECPACEGTGEIDDSKRDGVSVFPDEDGLYRYMISRKADIQGSMLVELEGEPTDDEDFDADEGALLIRPTSIVDVREPNIGRMDALRR